MAEGAAVHECWSGSDIMTGSAGRLAWPSQFVDGLLVIKTRCITLVFRLR